MSYCQCERPQPIDVTDEEFLGLFDETPLRVERFQLCGRCGLELAPDDGGYALPDEFPNDGDDADHDFTEGDVVT